MPAPRIESLEQAQRVLDDLWDRVEREVGVRTIVAHWGGTVSAPVGAGREVTWGTEKENVGDAFTRVSFGIGGADCGIRCLRPGRYLLMADVPLVCDVSGRSDVQLRLNNVSCDVSLQNSVTGEFVKHSVFHEAALREGDILSVAGVAVSGGFGMHGDASYSDFRVLAR
jgi:hypothetical protein